MVCTFTLSKVQNVHMHSLQYATRAEMGGRGAVPYSLVDVAGHYAELQGVLIYYRGQWSMKSWRRAERAQIPFLHPHAAHISPHIPALPALVLLSACLRPCPAPAPAFPRPWPPACDWTGEAAQLQRISCSLRRPGGLSLQRGRKSWGMAKVWWHNKSSRTAIRFIITWKVSPCSSFDCILCVRVLVLLARLRAVGYKCPGYLCIICLHVHLQMFATQKESTSVLKLYFFCWKYKFVEWLSG